MVPETTRFYFYKDNNSSGYEDYAFFEDDGYLPETLGNYLSMHQGDLPTKEGYVLKGRTNTQGGTQIFPDETSIRDGYRLSGFSFSWWPVWELVPVVPKVIIHGAVGTKKAIKSITPQPDYLCFTANVDGSSVMLEKWGEPTPVGIEINDGEGRVDYNIGDVIVLDNVGDKVYMRNKSETPTGFSLNTYEDYYYFTIDGSVAVSGDINYLLCKNSTTTLTSDGCFMYLFDSCPITTPPKLPATTLTSECYLCMFLNCPIETIPSLPATTLTDECYAGMFIGCTEIKLSTTQTGEYQTPYRIPTNGTGTTAIDPLDEMFEETGGTFTGTPDINTTYYTSNTVV